MICFNFNCFSHQTAYTVEYQLLTEYGGIAWPLEMEDSRVTTTESHQFTAPVSVARTFGEIASFSLLFLFCKLSEKSI